MLRFKFSWVSEAVVERVKAADEDSLDRWSMRLLVAGSLDEVFA